MIPEAFKIDLKAASAIKPASWVKAGIYAGIIGCLYYGALDRLIRHDWNMEDYSHCWLIPLVVLYLVWEKREELVATPSVASRKGLIFLGLGIVLFWLGELAGEFFSLYVSLWFVIVGLLWTHLGWNKIKAIWFALVMIIAMFPLPNVINVKVTFKLKLISSQVGVWMLHIYGMSAYREGNIIDLGFTQLQVVDACSGLRYVFPLMVLSLLLAYWFKAHFWKRTLLFLSSIPLAILVNSFRIALTGILYQWIGAKAAEEFFHGFSGWLIFMGTIPVLLAEMWILRKLPPREEESRKKKAVTDVASDGQPFRAKSTLRNGKFFSRLFIIPVVILAGTLVLANLIDFGEKVPIKKKLSGFPLSIGGYNGSRQGMEQQFLDILTLSDYVIINYKDGKGRDVNFYTAYYETQRKGESIHSPETCLPGSGWLFREAGAADIPLGGGKHIPVNRAFMEKSGVRELSYYWFPMRGRVLTNMWQMKVYTFWDALTRQRSDGALVRLITPVYPSESLTEAETRLQEFTKLIVPVLKEYIPE